MKTPPRAAVPAQPDALRHALESLVNEAQKVADDYHKPRYARLDEAIASARAVLHAQVAALTAAQPVVFDEQGFRAWVLKNLPDDTIIGNSAWWASHLTQWAQRFVRITPPASQGAAERAAPATAGGDTEADLKEWVEAATAASRTSQVPEDFITHREAWRNALTWLRDHPEDIDDASYWAHELTVFDQAYRDLAKFSASAQTEHVAAGVSENGLESNMTDPAVEREAFEEFAKMDPSNVSLVRDGDGYVDMAAALVWHGWEARAARAAAPVSNMTGGADPTPDELRAIARKARDSSGSASDDCGPSAYVLYGWRAAMSKVPSIEDLCSRIKAADDSAADRDYMLDSNDCIAVLRGEWKGPLAMDKPDRASHAQAPAGVTSVCIPTAEVEKLFARKPRDITLYNGGCDEPYIDIDGRDLWCNASDFPQESRWAIRWIVQAAQAMLVAHPTPTAQAAPAAAPGVVRVCPECDIAGCRHLRAQAPAAGAVAGPVAWVDAQPAASPAPVVPLTPEQIVKVAAPYFGMYGFKVEPFARAIEAAHGITSKEGDTKC